MKTLISVMIALCAVQFLAFSQCYNDPRNFRSVISKNVLGEIDTVIKTTYRLDENGTKTKINQTTYTPIVGGLLGSYVDVNMTYGDYWTENIYTYDEEGKVLSSKLISTDYGVVSAEDIYYYTTKGCDSLAEYIFYNIYSGEGARTNWRKVEINGLVRTEYLSDSTGILSKTIFTYNEQGRIIKKVDYISRNEPLSPDAEPWLTTKYYYDEAGNNIKSEHLNNQGKVVEVYVQTFDEYGNMLKQNGDHIEGEENPLDFAHQLLESIDKDGRSMTNEYKYDAHGNIIEAKWKYGTDSYFGHMFTMTYIYKE